MKAFMIVCDQELEQEMEFIFRANQIQNYTLFRNVEGKGESGLKLGNATGPGYNLAYWVTLEDILAKKFLSELKQFKEKKLKKKGVQVFVLPLEDSF